MATSPALLFGGWA